MRQTIAAILAVLAGISSAAAGIGPDGIALSVDRSAVAGNLALSWSGGQQPFLVHRSNDPAAVVTAATRIANTPETSLVVPEGPEPIDYFLVVDVNLESEVAATSACLTAGTSAQSAIEVDLRDSLGNPLEGLTVIMSTDVGALGPVVADSGTYRAVLTPPAVASGPATIGITADGAVLTAQPSVSIVEPLTANYGAAGGCPADGNLRVRVLDEAGEPISGANVMIGTAEMLDAYRTIPGGLLDGPNTGFSGPDGYLEFVDFGSNLDGPQTVTAAASDRLYVTIVDVDAADLVLPLDPVDADPPTAIFNGDVTNVPAPPNDPIELAMMVSDLSFETIQRFSTTALLADKECYEAGGVADGSPLPGNAYVPEQCALQILICLQQLAEHEYVSPELPYGDRRLLALRVAMPLTALTSGDLTQVLQSVSIDGIGVVDRTASSPGPTRQDIPITDPVHPNLDCTIDNPPANADVACVAAGDWDSALDPGLSPGSGRLFVMGFRFGDAAAQSSPFVIPDVTTVVAAGDFSGIDYVAAAVAQYRDPAKPGIPPGTENGTSAVLERSGAAFDGSGGSLAFDDFFPIRTLARSGRELSMEALHGFGHPTANLNRVVLARVITETYTACVADDSTRTRRQPLWMIYLPGTTNTWELPTPPVGWPRQEVGGDLAGLFDPAETPEDDTLEYSALTFHLGTFPGFDYNRLRFPDVRLHATHVTRNHIDY